VLPERADGVVPAVGLLFSGGLDCMVLAALVHRVLPAGVAITLYNVAFANPRVVAAAAAAKSSGDPFEFAEPLVGCCL
jgi:asparagine synthetase B (glutamine-hydrolysing)